MKKIFLILLSCMALTHGLQASFLSNLYDNNKFSCGIFAGASICLGAVGLYKWLKPTHVKREFCSENQSALSLLDALTSEGVAIYISPHLTRSLEEVTTVSVDGNRYQLCRFPCKCKPKSSHDFTFDSKDLYTLGRVKK